MADNEHLQWLRRLKDDALLKSFAEDPCDEVYLVVQDRILDLFSHRDPKLGVFYNRISRQDSDELPLRFQALHKMLHSLVTRLLSQHNKIQDLKWARYRKMLYRDTSLRGLLEHLVRIDKFTRSYVEGHLEHRNHMNAFDRCIDEELIQERLLRDPMTDEVLYYVTWKARTLVSEWLLYDID